MVWTTEQIEYVKENYGKMPTKELAEKLGRKPQTIAQYCHKHNITCGRYWTKKQENYLESKVGKLSLREIAKRMGKPYREVIEKNYHMKLGSFLDNSEDLSLAEVSRLVGRNKETIKKTWVKYGLTIKKVGSYSMINQEELFEFMEKNPERWIPKECEEWYFETCGCKWFEKRKKEEFNKMVEKRWGKVV